MIEIKLTNYELFSAAMIGCKRQIEALAKNLQDTSPVNEGTGWSVHVEGAAGELATAKALGMYWNGSINTFNKGGDVTGLEVRTRSKDYYDLIVRSKDKDDSIYILVVGKTPTFRIVGWLYAREAKLDQYIQTYGNRPAAYFVPQANLHPIESLSSKIHDIQSDHLEALHSDGNVV